MATEDKRKLGDEWIGWNGKPDNTQLSESRSVFMLLAGTGLFFLIFLTLIQWFLIKPRLDQFSELLSYFLLYIIISTFVIFLVILFTIYLLILMEKEPPQIIGGRFFFNIILFLLPISLKIGKILGISIDRMGNSFVKVHNSLTQAVYKKNKKGSLILLVPRCIKKELAVKLKEFEKKYELNVYTVGGGSAALKILKEKNPSSVIGIACERDLISGIRDLNNKIPIIGIPNTRPEGPCKNTLIDIEYLEKIIIFFAKPHSNEIHP